MKRPRALLLLSGLVVVGVIALRLMYPSAPTGGVRTESLSHGRFARFTVFVPAGTPTSFVLFLSGADGWNAARIAAARELGLAGAMVAGIDLPSLMANLEADGNQCLFPDGDLENLSHFVQAYFKLPGYLDPIVAGTDAGGTLAYAVLAQAPKDTFSGAVSQGFCPALALNKPLCKAGGLDYTPGALAPGVDTPDVATPGVATPGVVLLPAKQLGNPWLVLPGFAPKACAAEGSNFARQVPDTELVQDSLQQALARIAAKNGTAALTPPPPALQDLPIVSVPAKLHTASSDALAILLSGDGGWAGLDQNVAAALSSNGIPVVGLDSLRYFWSARTPDGIAKDIDRLIGYYLPVLGKKRVLLIGYSQGADVLPFAANRLDAASRSHVALAVVMGLSEHALFEFHMASWISDDNSGPPTLPEVDRIRGFPVLCIYGEEETDSLCPKLDAKQATLVKLKGGHHFDGDYSALANAILEAAHR